MGIATGTTLGRYEVRSLLGAGGMGEVYLAQDTQLRRPVALKLLPAQFTQDEDRLHRFEQEAYAASALNHPNILTIYEIGNIDATRFIAMEYVEGETLRRHLSRTNSISGEGHSTGHGIKLNEALEIAIQIASALAAAQTAGIAHRDIKPENLMLRGDGYVKVLDFGLAKLTERPATTDTEAPTRAMVNTSPGAVMGTVNYMSPEQASAVTVDSRSDIWSLGVLLYEMVTGRLPFEGPTPSHVIVSILEKDPPALTRYITDAPEALEWIVTKALTKNRDDRYQTAREMLTDLRRLKQRLDASAEMERSVSPDSGNRSLHLSTGGMPVASTLSAFPAPATNTQIGAPTVSSAEYIATSMGRHKLALIGAVVLLLAAAASVALWLAMRESPTHTFRKVRLSQLTNSGKAGLATISPDGKYVVHVISDGRQASLWVRQIATASNVQIVQPAESRYIGLTFSQDGDYIYYVVYEKNSPLGVVYQIPVLGGTPRKIIEDVDTPVTFSPDGKRFAWIRNFPQAGETALMIANSDGTQQRKAASRLRPGRFQAGASVGPSWSPKGDLIACPAGGLEKDVDKSALVLVDVNTGAEKEATPLRWAFVQQVAWTPNGSSIVMAAQEAQGGPNQIWHVSYPDGAAERITNDLNNYNGVSLNRAGTTLTTVQSQISSSVWLTGIGNSDNATKVTFGTNEGGRGLALLPNGQVIYTVAGSGTTDLFIVNADGSNPRQLTSNAGLNGLPSPTADGRFIVFLSTRSGVPHLWRMDSDGSNVKQLTNGIAEVNPVVSPDGKWVIYQNITDLGLWKISIDGGTPQLVTNKLASQASVSPDGKLLACRYREQDLSDFKLGLIDFASGEIVKSIDIPPTDTTLRWSADGRAVLYAERRAGVSNIWSQPIDGSAPRQLTNFKADQIFSFDVSKDGKSLVLGRGTVSTDVVLIADTTN